MPESKAKLYLMPLRGSTRADGNARLTAQPTATSRLTYEVRDAAVIEDEPPALPDRHKVPDAETVRLVVTSRAFSSNTTVHKVVMGVRDHLSMCSSRIQALTISTGSPPSPSART